MSSVTLSRSSLQGDGHDGDRHSGLARMLAQLRCLIADVNHGFCAPGCLLTIRRRILSREDGSSRPVPEVLETGVSSTRRRTMPRTFHR